MENHIEFTKWVVAQGVVINGIAAHRFPGRGLGIIAEKNLKAGEVILSVPIKALRTIHTVPTEISKHIRGKTTTHALLAAELCLDTSPQFDLWRSVLPSVADFEESLPLTWDQSLQDLLPAAAKTLLLNQKRKLKLDWASISTAFPELDYNDFLYKWMIVNTRTFYYLSSKAKKKPARDDCMALNPFADYFNHASHGCTVTFASSGYTITTEAPINSGSEVYISYGNHSNDFLLAEYGFIMDSNAWDEISLDEYIIPKLSEKQKEHLKDARVLGKYVLDRETVCYRTQIVVRMLVLPLGRWRRFVDGNDDGEGDQGVVDGYLEGVLEEYRSDVQVKLEAISSLDVGLDSQRDTLKRRWSQIDILLQAALDRLKR
ncbi:SET [Glarea lozoyensis ATCC 20868]|uniref:SET n=1 Tax=Glarea lozoyensis (strain ATCC 20868 / MF5171) TaxID=1116229 RepID=S3D0W6_GLAL2|nr:SET [Glarea lozoyensis ATCC 20868]EPE32172.1 SET [Glarea lozoyensis ATCC 20868]